METVLEIGLRRGFVLAVAVTASDFAKQAFGHEQSLKFRVDSRWFRVQSLTPF
jgi:hypothetical protein